VLPTINRKSREPRAARADKLQFSIQQAIWIVPIDDTHCEEMRITVYPDPPKERSYHGAQVDAAKSRERKAYDRRLYGEITGNVPLEDKAMVESQGAIVNRNLEHPGYGDRAILLLRKMIRDGIADLANGHIPKGVLWTQQEMIDLDIGFEEYEIDKVPEFVRSLVPELQKQLEQASSRGLRMEDGVA
jgi:hypothetical protein